MSSILGGCVVPVDRPDGRKSQLAPRRAQPRARQDDDTGVPRVTQVRPASGDWREVKGKYDDKSVTDHAEWVAGEALRMMEVEMVVTGDADDEKCASLVEEMVRTELAVSC